MNYSELENEQKLIEEYIKRLGSEQNTDDMQPIYDGVIDSKAYTESPYRIAWVLKEPYEDFDKNGNPCGGDWHFSDIMDKADLYEETIKGIPTFEVMSYITYGIQNGLHWDDMDFVYENPDIANALKSIVLINTSKFPGYTSTSWSKLYSDYEYWRPILLFQLKVYEPQIVIFGNTMNLYQKDLGLHEIIQYYDNEELGTTVPYAIKNGTLYIGAYHPAQRISKREIYIDSIISLAENQKDKLKH